MSGEKGQYIFMKILGLMWMVTLKSQMLEKYKFQRYVYKFYRILKFGPE